MDYLELNITDNPRAYIKNYSSYLDGDNNIVIIGSVAKSDYQIYPQNVTVGILAFNNSTAVMKSLLKNPIIQYCLKIMNHFLSNSN